MKIDQNQINEWKAKHGEVFLITVEDKEAYLRKPDRTVLAYAMQQGQKSPLKMSEVLMNQCWLGGDEEMKTDDDLFIAASTKLDALVQIKDASLKKL